MRIIRLFVAAGVSFILLFSSGCSDIGNIFKSDNQDSSIPTTTPPPNTVITKPKPLIKSVEATTSGMGDKYFAILEITIENQGTDGTIIVKATLTQAGQTQTNEMVTSMSKGKIQVLRLVFPLKWLGGEWTQSVETTVP